MNQTFLVLVEFNIVWWGYEKANKIKNNFGITGETSFDNKLTEIGGLREKIVFSISAGITDFIFPRENQSDFDKIMEKYKNNNMYIRKVHINIELTDAESVRNINGLCSDDF